MAPDMQSLSIALHSPIRSIPEPSANSTVDKDSLDKIEHQSLELEINDINSVESGKLREGNDDMSVSDTSVNSGTRSCADNDRPDKTKLQISRDDLMQGNSKMPEYTKVKEERNVDMAKGPVTEMFKRKSSISLSPVSRIANNGDLGQADENQSTEPDLESSNPTSSNPGSPTDTTGETESTSWDEHEGTDNLAARNQIENSSDEEEVESEYESESSFEPDDYSDDSNQSLRKALRRRRSTRNNTHIYRPRRVLGRRSSRDCSGEEADLSDGNSSCCAPDGHDFRKPTRTPTRKHTRIIRKKNATRTTKRSTSEGEGNTKMTTTSKDDDDLRNNTSTTVPFRFKDRRKPPTKEQRRKFLVDTSSSEDSDVESDSQGSISSETSFSDSSRSLERKDQRQRRRIEARKRLDHVRVPVPTRVSFSKKKFRDKTDKKGSKCQSKPNTKLSRGNETIKHRSEHAIETATSSITCSRTQLSRSAPYALWSKMRIPKRHKTEDWNARKTVTTTRTNATSTTTATPSSNQPHPPYRYAGWSTRKRKKPNGYAMVNHLTTDEIDEIMDY